MVVPAQVSVTGVNRPVALTVMDEEVNVTAALVTVATIPICFDVPTGTLPKAPVEYDAVPGTPDPLSTTVCGLPVALSITCTEPFCTPPVFPGANCTVIVQVDPG